MTNVALNNTPAGDYYNFQNVDYTTWDSGHFKIQSSGNMWQTYTTTSAFNTFGTCTCCEKSSYRTLMVESDFIICADCFMKAIILILKPKNFNKEIIESLETRKEIDG